MDARTADAAAPASKFDRRKEAVVRAAMALVNRKGVRGMTLAEVGAELGLAPTAVGYYFRKKESLAAACFLESIARLRIITRAAAAETTAPAAVRRFVREFIAFRRRVEEGLEDDIAWFEDVRTIRDPQVDAAYVEMFRDIRSFFTLPGGGAPDRAALNAKAHLLLSQVYWAIFWLRRYDVRDYERMGERLLAVLEHGLAAPGRGWAFVDIDTRLDALVDKGEAARHAFLGAAAEMINEHGYRGASVNKISARLNVSKGAFYHYHDAKNDLVQACFEETARIMRAAQTAAEDQCGDALTSLTSLAAHLVGGQVSGQIRLLRTSALSAVPKDLRPRMMEGMDRITARLSSIVSDGAGDGSVRPVDSHIGAQVLSGAINAASELHHWAPGLSAEQAVDLYVRPMFTGLFEPR